LNLPLKELDAQHAQQLDRQRPVVVYCWDALCDMSPRAATWLELLGFEVYDYALGKVDWMAHGLPTEGSAADRPTALSFVRTDIATCTLSERAEEIKRSIDASPYGFGLVLADRVVLGRVRRSRLDDAADDASVDLLMEPGPSTTRPDADPAEVASQLQRSGAHTAVLTNPEGELLGVVRLSDIAK
jgi:hypothetical protein